MACPFLREGRWKNVHREEQTSRRRCHRSSMQAIMDYSGFLSRHRRSARRCQV